VTKLGFRFRVYFMASYIPFDWCMLAFVVIGLEKLAWGNVSEMTYFR